MLENKNNGEVLSRKDQACNYANKLLAEAQSELDRELEQQRYYRERPLGRPPTFNGPVGDGGMDIQDRVTEQGAYTEEANERDYYSSPEFEDNMKYLAYKVEVLELAVADITKGDHEAVEKYWQELQEPPK